MSVRRRAAAVADPLAWVLLLAAFFEGISDNWVHAAVLALAAGAVWVDAWARAGGRRVRPSVPLLPDGPMSRWVLVAGLVGAAVYCLVVGSWAIYTWPTTVAVAGVATLWLCAAWRGPLRDRAVPPKVSRRTAVLWWTVVVAGGSWELGALLQQPSLHDSSDAHPTLSHLMDTVLASQGGRTVTLAAWLALGWALLALAPLPGRAETQPTAPSSAVRQPEAAE